MNRNLPIGGTQQGGFRVPLLLGGAGFTAAFGAASCCGLPVLLGSLSLSSGWLAALAWFAAPYRVPLLIAAILCILSAVGVVVRRRRTVCATTGPVIRKAVAGGLLIAILLSAGVLAAMGFLYG